MLWLALASSSPVLSCLCGFPNRLLIVIRQPDSPRPVNPTALRSVLQFHSQCIQRVGKPTSLHTCAQPEHSSGCQQWSDYVRLAEASICRIGTKFYSIKDIEPLVIKSVPGCAFGRPLVRSPCVKSGTGWKSLTWTYSCHTCVGRFACAVKIQPCSLSTAESSLANQPVFTLMLCVWPIIECFLSNLVAVLCSLIGQFVGLQCSLLLG